MTSVVKFKVEKIQIMAYFSNYLEEISIDFGP